MQQAVPTEGMTTARDRRKQEGLKAGIVMEEKLDRWRRRGETGMWLVDGSSRVMRWRDVRGTRRHRARQGRRLAARTGPVSGWSTGAMMREGGGHQQQRAVAGATSSLGCGGG